MKTEDHVKAIEEMSSYRKRIKYCDNHFKRLGSGTGRIAYEFKDGAVIKLARNEKGHEQNIVESDFGIALMYEGAVNPPIDASEDGLWVICPKLEKVTMKDVCEYFKMSRKEFCDTMAAVAAQKDHRNRHSQNLVSDFDWDKLEEDHPQLDVLNAIVKDSDIIPGDWDRPSSWGKDPSTGRIVVADWGLTEEIMKRHYSRKTGMGMGV